MYVSITAFSWLPVIWGVIFLLFRLYKHTLCAYDSCSLVRFTMVYLKLNLKLVVMYEIT
jgi:hypothetical protein